MRAPGRKTYWYRDVFFATYGLGPWDCWQCHKPVAYSQLHIHHMDGNHGHNDSTNLVGVHAGCHSIITHRGKKLSPEAIKKMAEGHRGQKRSAEARARMSLAQRNRKWIPSAETRRKTSVAARRRAQTAEGKAHSKRMSALGLAARWEKSASILSENAQSTLFDQSAVR